MMRHGAPGNRHVHGASCGATLHHPERLQVDVHLVAVGDAVGAVVLVWATIALGGSG